MCLRHRQIFRGEAVDKMAHKNLREVLTKAESIDWRLALYLTDDVSAWNLDSLAMIEDPDDVDSDDPDEDPLVVKAAGYRYVMGCQSVKSIVDNAKAQRKNLSDEALFKCFMFYLENDAFIKL